MQDHIIVFSCIFMRLLHVLPNEARERGSHVEAGRVTRKEVTVALSASSRLKAADPEQAESRLQAFVALREPAREDLKHNLEVVLVQEAAVLVQEPGKHLCWLTGEWATSGLRFSDCFPLN